jgi:hypothetical protein
MKSICACVVLFVSMMAIATPADARGCLKGAVVGGAAGHIAGHHGVIGAVVGCAIGRHEANKHDRERERDGRQRYD